MVPDGDFVANTKSAEKAARQAEKHRTRNVALRSRMRTAVRSVTAAITGGNKETGTASYKEAVPVIDTLVNKQIIHRNKAARHKSRLAARIRAMQGGSDERYRKERQDCRRRRTRRAAWLQVEAGCASRVSSAVDS
jgi:small subunit ribosomal protein S20